ncbi:hypothetical protein ACFOY4_18915 [Actinomadura syzygii]|uniref:MarR family transcriptional regulator n=1 Tax=Actinomadura syzygii TaxID=1427538 RepID=A0A5D0U3E5_9ACTN|nr:hypothetical protein [Actinomadura syzygii]TYC12253.1 hypothetical protein FXF65_23580 [Actinomadura syzygii]
MEEREERRGDVQELSDFELVVYETVAEIDKEGGAADFETIGRLVGGPEEDLWAALGHLVSINHVHSTGDGYVLGPHDWAP